MHIIRVYKKKGGLYRTFKGLNAEQAMREAFRGEPDLQFYIVLR